MAGAVLVLPSGADAQPAQQERLLEIVVSINPYQDLVERVAGGRARVSTILPPGASPHAFDPTPSRATTLARADLVVMNGGLDLWLVRLIEAAAPDTPVLVVMDSLEFSPLEAQEHDEHGDEPGGHADHAHDHGATNSHIWLDPVLMIQAVDALAGALSELDPEGAPSYQANAARLQEELRTLDQELQSLLAPVAGAPFVPFHDAWVYFAQRYDLQLVIMLEPFPGREPSPRYVAEAVRDVMASGAKAIFAERQLGTRSAEVVAQSADVAVAVLDPLGGAPGPETYDELLLVNARVILEALAD